MILFFSLLIRVGLTQIPKANSSKSTPGALISNRCRQCLNTCIYLGWMNLAFIPDPGFDKLGAQRLQARQNRQVFILVGLLLQLFQLPVKCGGPGTVFNIKKEVDGCFILGKCGGIEFFNKSFEKAQLVVFKQGGIAADYKNKWCFKRCKARRKAFTETSVKGVLGKNLS